MTDDDRFWRIAREACTPGQLRALELNAKGYGYKRMATILGIGPDAARDRVQRGIAAVRRHPDYGDEAA